MNKEVVYFVENTFLKKLINLCYIFLEVILALMLVGTSKCLKQI